MSEEPRPADNVVRLNAGGVEGKLTASGGRQAPVRVFDRGDARLMLVLTMLAEEDLAGQPLLLEYASPRGLVRAHGEAVFEGRDLLSFRVSASPEPLQRREFVRVDAVAPVTLTIDETEVLVGTHALEVSGGGMLLARPAPLSVGTGVRFRLELSAEEAPIEGHGRVIRVEGEGQPVVVFDQVSAGDRQRLIRFVFERQRSALSRGAPVAPLKRPGGAGGARDAGGAQPA
jgi:hypothetical protein